MSLKDERLEAVADEAWFGADWRTSLVLGHCRSVPKFRGHGRVYQLMTHFLLNDKLNFRNSNGTHFTVASSDFVGWRMAYGGGYEPRSLALATLIMRDGGVFVDVGCNVGLYTLSIGALPNVRVVAIDASFTALHELEENVRSNPHIACIEIVHAALAAHPAVHSFELPDAQNLGMTRMTAGDVRRASQFWAAGTTLQILFRSLDVGPVQLVKLDVEGAELEVLQGLDFSGPQRPRNIIMECEPAFSRAPASLAFLEEQGYVIRTVTGAIIDDLNELPEHNVWCRCRSETPDDFRKT